MTFISDLVFSPLQLSDRDWMESCLKAGHRGSLEYSFSSLYIWRNVYKIEVARMGGYAVVLSNTREPSYIFPLGSGPLLPVLEALFGDAKKRGNPLRFNTVLEDDRARLEVFFPGVFRVEPIRDAYDYIYEAERLRTLSGKKLSSKRNQVNKFMMQYRDWSFEPISRENIDEVHAMSRAWCEWAGCLSDPGLFDESCAVEEAFRHYFELRFDGGCLRAGGRVVAFSMGDALNESIYLQHIEKALEVPGAYQMINQQFAQHFTDGYRFINREDDTGDEGLRKAKLSYDPAYLVAKYRATEIQQ